MALGNLQKIESGTASANLHPNGVLQFPQEVRSSSKFGFELPGPEGSGFLLTDECVMKKLGLEYQLLDSGDGRKWERFGEFVLSRPCPQAVWNPQMQIEPDAAFHRENGNQWTFFRKLPSTWNIKLSGVIMKITPTEFGHLGVFPEHAALWEWMQNLLSPGMRVLNLFAYSGGATLAAAQKGVAVCHLDASKGMVEWARENALFNGLKDAPIRWIVDDAIKFLKREKKRNVRYDGIVLDPPTFGRGSKGEVFKIEQDIQELLGLCRDLLSERPRFLIFSCHTPGFTPIVLSHLLGQFFKSPIETFEMLLESDGALSVPSGCVARIQYGSVSAEI